MKKVIPFLLLFIFTAACTSAEKEAQANLSKDELREIFRKDMNKYLSLINNADYDKAFDFIPAKVFEMATKEQMIDMYTQLEERGMRMEMDIFKITEISKVIPDGNTNYCKFMYDGKITVHLSGMLLGMKDELVTQFETQYEGASMQVFEEKIEIALAQTIFAVSDEGSKDWKYVEYNNTSKEQMHKIIPIEIINELK